MNYFIDFEATQYSEEIISVGCIREDGETFYSLVAPVEGKITPFITNLTGITAEMLKEAMSSDKVFELFYNWAFKDSEDVPNFYVWGDCDIRFLKRTFEKTSSKISRMAIGYICGSLKDYSDMFCNRVKIDNCSLIKAYNSLIDKDKKQNHNALDDAVLLKEVFYFSNSLNTNNLKRKIKKFMPEKYQKKEGLSPKWNQAGLPSGTICLVNKTSKRLVKSFASINEAIDWVIKEKVTVKNPSNVNRKNIEDRIKRAYNNGIRYCGKSWRRVE